MGGEPTTHRRPSSLVAGTGTQRGRIPGPTGTTDDPGILDKVGYVTDAITGIKFTDLESAIAKHTTEDFKEIIKGLLPGLVLAVGTVLTTTLIGAGVGSLAGGVGAAPGAVIGAKVGLAILTYLGLGFLAVYVLDHIGEAGIHFKQGISLAWNSQGSELRITLAGREITEGIGVIFSLLIQAILVFLLKRGGKGMSKLRESKLFKWCPKLEAWISANFIRLCFRYKIKTGIPVIKGGRIGPPKYIRSVALARRVLRDMMSGTAPKFKSFRELHAYLLQKGFRVSKDPKQTMVYGPKDASTGRIVKDAAQAIYTNTEGTVVVKIKTRGYPWGGRSNGTMSIEITDGGSGWSNVLAKLSKDGNLISKTRLAQKDVVVLNDGVYAITKGAKGKLDKGAKMEELSRGGFGNDLRKVVEFELIEGGGVKPMSQDAFADKGHIDFLKGFNPDGAWNILNLTPP